MPLATDRMPEAIALKPKYQGKSAPTASLAVAVVKVRTLAAINVQANSRGLSWVRKAVPMGIGCFESQKPATIGTD